MGEAYLDNCATTRVDEDVAALALRLMREEFGNPSSLHGRGLGAQRLLNQARARVAAGIGCTPEEILFTSGGTEANNMALFGGARALERRGKTLVSVAWEHSSVLGPLRQLEQQGFTLKLVKPEADGTVDRDKLLAAVDDDTILVSCMLVNSEVGTILPVGELMKAVRRKNKLALLHCDAVQALGKVPFSAAKLGVDLLTVSAHKIHAPKGCGALYLRRGVRIVPLSYGGSQENQLRPGTESTPLCCAFGLAVENTVASLEENWAKVAEIREYFVKKIEILSGICMNSQPDATPYICNISVPGYRSQNLLNFLSAKEIYVSSGSACNKGAVSHVLTAMELPLQRADSALRISFSKHSSKEDVDALIEGLSAAMREVARQN